MARSANEVQKLARQIDLLPARKRLQLLDQLLTPQTELDLAIERIHRQTRRLGPRQRRALERAIDRSVQEVRGERRARARSA
ncbi:MAG: hypothetical protein HYY06_10815 [Deltaproteobacteria bacterium]|nr:hypothetical protein [Deltaproteobacteria bacterium]